MLGLEMFKWYQADTIDVTTSQIQSTAIKPYTPKETRKKKKIPPQTRTRKQNSILSVVL